MVHQGPLTEEHAFPIFLVFAMGTLEASDGPKKSDDDRTPSDLPYSPFFAFAFVLDGLRSPPSHSEASALRLLARVAPVAWRNEPQTYCFSRVGSSVRWASDRTRVVGHVAHDRRGLA